MRRVLYLLGIAILVIAIGAGVFAFGFVKHISNGLVIVSTSPVRLNQNLFGSWMELFKQYQTNRQYKIVVLKDVKPAREELTITQSLTEDNVSDVTLMCDWKATLWGGRARILRIDFDRSRYVVNVESKQKFNSAAIYCLGKLFNLDSDKKSSAEFEQQFTNKIENSQEQPFIL